MSNIEEGAESHGSLADRFSNWRRLVDRQVGQAGSGACFDESFEALPGGLKEAFAKTLALAAARKGDEEALSVALRSCPASHKDGRGVSLSHFAAAWMSPNMLIALAEAGANLAASDVLGRTPLDCAVEAGREACVEALLARGVRPARSKSAAREGLGGWNCLHEAARRGDVGIAERLLAAGADIDATNAGGNTALSLAAGNGRIEMTRLLLGRGASASLQENFGAAPLHAACESGHEACVKDLLAHGADPEMRRGASTALLAATRSKSAGCVQELARHGANLDAMDGNGNTALIIACCGPIDEQALSIIEELARAGASREQANNEGAFPLSALATRMQESSWLAEHAERGRARLEIALRAMEVVGQGVNHDQTDIYGMTPAMRAAIAGSPSALALLSRGGADLNKECSIGADCAKGLKVPGFGTGCTPAIFFAATGNLACLLKLDELGVDILAANSLGVTPKAAAERFAKQSVAAALSVLGERAEIERGLPKPDIARRKGGRI